VVKGKRDGASSTPKWGWEVSALKEVSIQLKEGGKRGVSRAHDRAETKGNTIPFLWSSETKKKKELKKVPGTSKKTPSRKREGGRSVLEKGGPNLYFYLRI